MSLLIRKIPILPTINDVPSTTGEANHPNASLLCAKYNALIDNELTAISNIVNSLTTTTKVLANNHEFYLDVDATNNGAGTLANPFNSVSALITELNSKIYTENIYVYINGDTDLGDFSLSITSYGQDINEERPIKLYFEGRENTETITIGGINTNITINFDNMIVEIYCD